MDLRKTYQSIDKALSGKLIAALLLVFVVCVSNVLDLKTDIQLEVEKIELADSELETDIEEKEETKDSEKYQIVNNSTYYSTFNSAFHSHTDFINRPTNYHVNIPTPPPDFL